MLKAKMTAIVLGKPPLDDLQFARFLKLPEKLTMKTLARSVLGKDNKPTALEVEIFGNYRMVGRRSLDAAKAHRTDTGENLSDDGDDEEEMVDFGEPVEDMDNLLDDDIDMDEDDEPDEDGLDSGEDEDGEDSDDDMDDD